MYMYVYLLLHFSLIEYNKKNYKKDLYYKSPHENIGLQEVHSIIQKRTICTQVHI